MRIPFDKVKIAECLRVGMADRAKAGYCFCLLAMAAVVAGLSGCTETAKVPPAASTGQVYTYYSGPVTSSNGDNFIDGQFTIDESSGKKLSFEEPYQGSITPKLEGIFTSTDAGSLNITETAVSTYLAGTTLAPVTGSAGQGAWLAEIPGYIATGNVLDVTYNTSSQSTGVLGGEGVIMVDNTACPDYSKAQRFVFVPVASQGSDSSNYGTADISTQGSTVNFNVNYYALGGSLASPVTVSAVTACGSTPLGSLISYPVNQYTSSNSEGPYLSAIAQSLVLAGTIPAPTIPNLGAQGRNVVGLAVPASAVDPKTLSGKHFIGLLNSGAQDQGSAYDPGVLAAGFGYQTAATGTCPAFQAAITSSVTSGGIAQAPSANAIYGGDFPADATTNIQKPGTGGTENCDMAIDLGAQDSTNNGLFPNAQLYYMPVSPKSSTAALSSGTAVAGQVDGRYVILFTAKTGPVAPVNSWQGTSEPGTFVLFEALQ